MFLSLSLYLSLSISLSLFQSLLTGLSDKLTEQLFIYHSAAQRLASYFVRMSVSPHAFIST